MARKPVLGQNGRWRNAFGTLAIVGGVMMLTAGAFMIWQHATAPPTYRYVMGDAVPETELGPLSLLGQRDRTVRRASVVSSTQEGSLAELTVADSPTGPVLVSWQPRGDDPFLTLPPPSAEVAALVPVLERHVAKGKRVLAWWDTSRQLAAMSDTAVAFDSHLGTPLFVPTAWRGMRSNIESIERDFWRIPEAPEPQAQFLRFVDALLADETKGMAELRALAGGKAAILVLHTRDAVLLGQLAPKRIGVAFRDFGAMADVHGMVRRVHTWLDEHAYAAYTTLEAKDKSVRAVALTDAPSAITLAARLLPFVGNDQSDVQGATLVYRVGGFMVYEIAAAESLAASDLNVVAAAATSRP